MESVKLAISEIRRFLSSPEPEVLCISGDWGVGKTFTWEKILGEAAKATAVALKRYGYVSLFGQASLDTLKQSIFENTEFLVDDEEEFKLQAKSIANTALGGVKKGRNLLAAIPYVGQSLEKVISASNGVLFATVRGQLICIDDIERRGDGLRVKDVLGLVSFLREQRRCKIVILLNDKELDEERVDFTEQMEKVIDTYIRFSPNASESVAIALDPSDALSKEIGGHCVRLKINNIRIIRRIHRLASIALPSIEGNIEEIRDQALRTISLFAWAHLDRKKAPDPSFIKKGSASRLFVDKNATPLTEQESQWNAVLKEFKFRGVDQLDEEIINGIENGFFNHEELKRIANEKESEFNRGEGERQLWQAWDLVKHTFEDNTDEIVVAMRSAVRAPGKLSLPNINSTIAFVRSLDREKDAEEMIEDVVSQDLPAEYWNFRRGPFFGEITDENFRKAIDRKFDETKVETPIEDLLVKVGSQAGWNDDEIESLSNADPDEVEKLLRANRGEQFDKILVGLTTFLQISNASPQMKKINATAKTVLDRFGVESAVNAIRVRGYLKGA